MIFEKAELLVLLYAIGEEKGKQSSRKSISGMYRSIFISPHYSQYTDCSAMRGSVLLGNGDIC